MNARRHSPTGARSRDVVWRIEPDAGTSLDGVTDHIG